VGSYRFEAIRQSGKIGKEEHGGYFASPQ
jgi:hypothetical protein